MNNPYPLPRELRETAELFGDGGSVYGPFAFSVFDIEDVMVWIRPTGAAVWSEADVAVTKTTGATFDTFSIAFPYSVATTTKYKVLSRRIHERAAGVTSGTRIDPNALEKELSKQGTVLQEMRRDLLRGVQMQFGDGFVVSDTLEDGDTLMKSGNRLVAGPNASEIQLAQAFAADAAASRDVAEEAASDAAASAAAGQAFAGAAAAAAESALSAQAIFSTISSMAAIDVPAGLNAIRVNGRDAAGDGEGGLFVSANNGSNDTFTSGDGRTWYRAYEQQRQITVDRALDIEGSFIGKTVGTIDVRGFYTRNDGGHGAWRRVASEPAHAAKKRSADRYLPDGSKNTANGGWWEPVAGLLTDIKACGAKADWNVVARTGTDNAPFVQAAAIIAQAAANATGTAGGGMYVPAGHFGLKAKIFLGEASKLCGAGRGMAYFHRSGDYGDTFVVANGAYAREFEMHNLEIHHSLGYDRTTNAPMLDPITNSQSAHVRIYGAQRCSISRCNLQRLKYGLYFVGGSNVILDDILFYGVWDVDNPANQEGVAQVIVDTAPGYTNVANWTVKDCYFAGQSSNERSLTWSVNGAPSAPRIYNRSIGSLYGLLFRSVENCLITGNHFGGLTTAELGFVSNDGVALLDARVVDNFFDGSSHGVGILVEPDVAATTHSGLDIKISGNVFIDQRNGVAVKTNGAGGVSLFGLKIHDNKFRNMIGCPIWLSGAKGYAVTENEIEGFNRLNLSTTDPTYCAGVLTDLQAAVGEVKGNRIGGGVSFQIPGAVTTAYPNATGAYTWFDILNYGAGENYNYDNNSILCANRKAPVTPSALR